MMLEDKLRSALTLDIPYPERPPARTGKPAAVLLLFGLLDGDWHLLLTRRTETVETHKGQIAFPGGRLDGPEIEDSGGTVLAAVRETEEEVGISRTEVRTLGTLPGLWTVTGFWVTPVIGVLKQPIAAIEMRLNPHEIAEALWIPLSRISDPAVYRREVRQYGSVSYPVHVYDVEGMKIWGATGSMIKNLLDRLETLG